MSIKHTIELINKYPEKSIHYPQHIIDVIDECHSMTLDTYHSHRHEMTDKEKEAFEIEIWQLITLKHMAEYFFKT